MPGRMGVTGPLGSEAFVPSAGRLFAPSAFREAFAAPCAAYSISS